MSLCSVWHGKHSWSQWGEPEAALDGFGEIVIQRRKCRRCGEVGIREVRTDVPMRQIAPTTQGNKP